MALLGRVCLLAIACTGCAMMARREAYVSEREPIGLTKATRSLDKSDLDLVRRAGQFENKFLNVLGQAPPYVASPYGAYQALSVVLNGSQSDTFEGLCRVMGLDDPNLERLNMTHSRVLDVLVSQPSRAMVASSLWSVPPIKFSPRYHDDMAKWYGAEVRKTGSAGLNARGQINDWAVARSTEQATGTIMALSKETDSLILLSVVDVTLPLLADSRSRATVLASDAGKEAQGDGYRAFGLNVPGSTLELWIIEPIDDEEPGAALARITRQDMAEWSKSKTQPLALSAPSDRFSSRVELTGVLASMGGGSLIQGPNDFTAMSHETKSGFRISQFVQFCELRFVQGTAITPSRTRKLRKQPAVVVREASTGLTIVAGTWGR